jgi:hypothetical protein
MRLEQYAFISIAALCKANTLPFENHGLSLFPYATTN